MTAPNNATAIAAPMPFWMWVFLRIAIPTGPILIQCCLWAAGLYDPPIAQPTFIVLVFGLALVTATEYRELKFIYWASFLPALAATVLYTAYILPSVDPKRHERILVLGFYLWISLVAINLVRVLWDVLRHEQQGVK